MPSELQFQAFTASMRPGANAGINLARPGLGEPPASRFNEARRERRDQHPRGQCQCAPRQSRFNEARRERRDQPNRSMRVPDFIASLQ